jgi:hypothetical protein
MTKRRNCDLERGVCQNENREEYCLGTVRTTYQNQKTEYITHLGSACFRNEAGAAFLLIEGTQWAFFIFRKFFIRC